MARSFFRYYLPPKDVELIDLDRLKIHNQSYVDEKLKDKHSDIVYQTRFKGSVGFLYILFEHQSTPDRWMVFRLLCYMVNLWKAHIDQNPKARCIPVIYPMVLYHGRKPWDAPRQLWELIDKKDHLSDYTPHFTYNLFDLNDYPDEQLLIGNDMALNVVIYLLKHIFDDQFKEIFVQAIKILSRIHDRDAKFCVSFREILKSAGIKPIRLPPFSPNLNAYAERFVRSVKEECLSKLILFGENSLRRALNQYLVHYHHERNHQGLQNEILFLDDTLRPDLKDNPIVHTKRLNFLSYYFHSKSCTDENLSHFRLYPTELLTNYG